MEKHSNYGEMLRHENEITKLKIQAEFGIELNNTGELNPAIENIWLNQILEYERGLINNKKITVHELVGQPPSKNVEELSDEEVGRELQELMELLRRKNIVVESMTAVDDREMYRFITKELFFIETDSHFPANMIVCYIYEEFHPNDEFDIRKNSTNFIHCFADLEDITFDDYMYDDKGDDVKQNSFERLKHRLILFRNAFDQIRLDAFAINSVLIQEFKADVVFDFNIAVLLPDAKSFRFISGKGKFIFIKDFGNWLIDGIEMKGVV